MKDHEGLTDLAHGPKVGARGFWKPNSRVGVIGGHGEMGRLFTNFFKDLGCRVDIADVDTERTGREVLEDSDVVLFAVPLHETVKIIGDLVPYVRPDQLLMDVTSLKVGPVREMLRSSAAVVGLHPMFGGRIATLAGQTLVACPVRISPESWGDIRDLFIQKGIRVKECTPEEHDRMMSIIQVLFHMTTMLVGRVLRELSVDIAETMEFTSPSYRLEINLLGRMFAQNGALYSAISQMNPYTKDILSSLMQGLSSYQEWYQGQDLDAFMRDFQKSAEHLGDFCSRAYEESSAVLDFGVRLARLNGGP
ncbi:prephenate dehydrogenase/arogenate dehydrogenase family protein [Desulfoferrobacter suflitae]|uniref:prephenate dehydrogenase/arogenate dehydrogenase family protein n=1 Tax=Desulfoferrobacter suflitae TaxID=2865782 RepID=UPI0021640CCF|nr:prephenate dehydrogenase/arogenate dehydrogenase family protein [Desulfoferrobacter suflitae]MCK8600566.1 prephenate dehydrogenase/arogenate dehydrogenase family protein [Desulfoferrobacter suflitae]